MKRRFSLAFSVLLMTCLISPASPAQPGSAEENTILRSEIEALRERLDQLEASTATTEITRDRISISGDLRYRHETINDDAFTERNRHRIRARVRVESEIGDDLEVGITLATGASNPVSANQTLGGGLSRKDIGVDRAYFRWRANDNVSLRGGKMGNPVFRPTGHFLIFDGDLNPEGLALAYAGSRIFANAVGFWMDERGGSDQDAVLLGIQGGISGMLVGDAELTLGMSYYDYKNTQGGSPFYLGLAQGNSVDINGNLVNDYDLVELFAEASLNVGGQPLRVFVDYVENTEADRFDTGYAFGARWRRASAPGSWEASWAYEDLEADAVIANFTDSDFGGGGTDHKGHFLRGVYVWRQNVSFTGTYFLNERGAAAGNERDYKRLQLDISLRF